MTIKAYGLFLFVTKNTKTRGDSCDNIDYSQQIKSLNDSRGDE